MSRENYQAAGALIASGFWRSSVSRSYYAAYCAITGHLSSEHFPRDWQNPDHEQLPRLIKDTIALSRHARRKILRSINFLRHMRITADYKPRHSVNEQEARDCRVLAATVLKEMGVF